ncbi:hypothetical protein O181_015483 [Austropuccinia psidii MF-1]|uniref:Uncharacterized protein n=1 Tax=Austropuccinia psidii MF-1 TaxID=1389203 RepID=A0A9Q3C3B4_9BASI|nr:hypothetical protein [Austropuccinia psidii MF-1]
MQKGKGKRHSENLINRKNWKPIDTQKTRKPEDSASRHGKKTLINCTRKITISNTAVTSKEKFTKAAAKKLIQGTVKGKYPKKRNVFDFLKTLICPLYNSGTLESQETSQRTDQDCSKPNDQGLDSIVDGRTLREIIPMLPFTFQWKKNLKP